MVSASARPAFHQVSAFVAFMTAIAIPFRISGVAVEQALLVLALLASFVCVWQSHDVRTNFVSALKTLQGKLIALVFVAWAVVLPFSPDLAGSLEISARTGLFVLAAVLVGSVLKSAPQHHALVRKVFLISAFGLGVAALLSLLGMEQILALLTANFDGITYAIGPLKPYATAIVCALPVVVLFGRELHGKWRLFGYAYIPVVGAVIVLTGNRSALAGVMAVATAFLLLRMLGQGKNWKGVLGAILAVVAITILWVRYDRIDYAQSKFDNITYLPGWLIDPHRQNIWSFVYEKFLEHPWVGNGVDQINRLPGAHEIVQGLGDGAYVVPSHPHNWVLEILAETGLIGFVPVVIALGFMVWKTLKAYIASNSENELAKLLVFVGFLSCSLFSYSIWAAWWQLVFYILLALLWSLRDGASRASEKVPL